MIGDLLDLARAHAPLLLWVAPLAGGALAAAIPSARLSWVLTVIVLFGVGLLAVDLCLRTLGSAEPVGGIVEGIGIAADGVSLFAAPLVALCALLTAVAGGGGLAQLPVRTPPLAMALSACCAAGWLGALMAQDLVGLFVAVETGALAAIGLVAIGGERERAAYHGAARMLVANGVGAVLLLIGAGLIYASVGSIEVGELAAAPIASTEAASVGVGLMLAGLAIKAAAAPLHQWLAPAVGRANGLAMLAVGVLTVVGASCVLARVSAYALTAPAIGAGVQLALAALGGVSVVIGSAQAVGARNLPRLTAYAGVAQVGGVLLCVALGSPAGYAAAFVQLTAFAAAMLALYAGAGAGGVFGLSGLDGLGRRAPLASAAMTLGAISLMGAPLTLGFLGRWRLVEAGVGAGWWWAAGAVIFASLAGVFYGGRLVERLYFRRAAETFAGGRDLWALAYAPAMIAAMLIIVWGVAPGPLLSAADSAAAIAMGGVR